MPTIVLPSFKDMIAALHEVGASLKRNQLAKRSRERREQKTVTRMMKSSGWPGRLADKLTDPCKMWDEDAQSWRSPKIMPDGFQVCEEGALDPGSLQLLPETGILSQNLAAYIGTIEATLGSESMKLSERMEREKRQGL